MSRPGQTVVLYTLSTLKGKDFWSRLRAVIEAHGRLLVPHKDTPVVYTDEDMGKRLPEEATKEEWDRFVEHAFLGAKESFALSPDWGDLWGPSILVTLLQPYGSPWGYSIEMVFEDVVFYQQGMQLCEAITELCKDLFVEIPCDFGFACHEYLEERHRRIFMSQKKDAKTLRFIPTLPAEDEANYLLVSENYWSLSYKPVWFYLLSPDRYEASKPYLPNLPVEAHERFPHLKDYGLQRIEELPNGGAFLFLGYPYDLEDSSTA